MDGALDRQLGTATINSLSGIRGCCCIIACSFCVILAFLSVAYLHEARLSGNLRKDIEDFEMKHFYKLVME